MNAQTRAAVALTTNNGFEDAYGTLVKRTALELAKGRLTEAEQASMHEAVDEYYAALKRLAKEQKPKAPKKAPKAKKPKAPKKPKTSPTQPELGL